MFHMGYPRPKYTVCTCLKSYKISSSRIWHWRVIAHVSPDIIKSHFFTFIKKKTWKNVNFSVFFKKLYGGRGVKYAIMLPYSVTNSTKMCHFVGICLDKLYKYSFYVCPHALFYNLWTFEAFRSLLSNKFSRDFMVINHSIQMAAVSKQQFLQMPFFTLVVT